MEYESAKTIKRTYDISNSTLQKWANEGKLKCIKLLGGKRLYNKTDFVRLTNGCDSINASNSEPESIIYARVSSTHQREDLNRQIEFLKSKYPTHTVISDIGSGLNYKRQGLKTILEQCLLGNIKEIVVTDKDRICRFGFELFEWIVKKFNVRLVVQFNQMESSTGSMSTEHEMSQDILAICNYFVAKNNGLRGQRNRRERKELRGSDKVPVEHNSQSESTIE